MAWPHTFDNDTVRAIIRNEGLLYAITSYTNGDPIEDEKLKALWKKTHNDIEFFQNFLEDHDLSPGILIHNKKGYFVIVDNEKTKYTEMPVSELGEMGKYITEKIHPQIIEILNILKMDVKEYGKKYKTGGTIPAEAQKIIDEIYSINEQLATDVRNYDLANKRYDLARQLYDDFGIRFVNRKFKVIKAKLAYIDDWSRNIYKGDNGKYYADVDGIMHTITQEGEPDYPVYNVDIGEEFAKGGLITKSASIFNKRISINDLFSF